MENSTINRLATASSYMSRRSADDSSGAATQAENGCSASRPACPAEGASDAQDHRERRGLRDGRQLRHGAAELSFPDGQIIAVDVVVQVGIPFEVTQTGSVENPSLLAKPSVACVA